MAADMATTSGTAVITSALHDTFVDELAQALKDAKPAQLAKIGGVIGIIVRQIFKMNPTARSGAFNLASKVVMAAPQIPAWMKIGLAPLLEAIPDALRRAKDAGELDIEDPGLRQKELFKWVAGKWSKRDKDKDAPKEIIEDKTRACTGDDDDTLIHHVGGCARALRENTKTGSIIGLFTKYEDSRDGCPACFPELRTGLPIIALHPADEVGDEHLIDVATPDQARAIAVFEGIMSLRRADAIHEPLKPATLMLAEDAGLLAHPRAVHLLPEVSVTEAEAFHRVVLDALRRHRKEKPLKPTQITEIDKWLIKFQPYIAMIRRIGNDETGLKDDVWFTLYSISDYVDDRFTDVERAKLKRGTKSIKNYVLTTGQEYGLWAVSLAKWGLGIISALHVFLFGLGWVVTGVSWLAYLALIVVLLFVNYPGQLLLGTNGQMVFIEDSVRYISFWGNLMALVYFWFVVAGVGTFVGRFLVVFGDKGINMILGTARFVAGLVSAKQITALVEMVSAIADRLRGKEAATESSSSSNTEDNEKENKPFEAFAMLATTWTIIAMVCFMLVSWVYALNLGLLGTMLAIAIGGVIGLVAEYIRHFRERISEEEKTNDVIFGKKWLTRLMVGMLVLFGIGGLSATGCTATIQAYKSARCEISDQAKEEALREGRSAPQEPSFCQSYDKTRLTW